MSKQKIGWPKCRLPHTCPNALHLKDIARVIFLQSRLTAQLGVDLVAARDETQATVSKLWQMRLAGAATLVEQHIEETFSYYRFPPQHWLRIRTNNPLERVIREIRRRTRVVVAFPDGNADPMLAAARFRHTASTKWGARRYPKMELLTEVKELDSAIA